MECLKILFIETFYLNKWGVAYIKADPLMTRVYEYISHKIQIGEYKPNQRITEVEICNAIGVSRTPAREALTRLEAENLLDKIPNKGFVVKEFQEKEKLDTYLVIGVLDSLAGTLSIDNLTEEEINKMEELIEMMEIAIKYRNYNNYLHISNDFHQIYRSKCDNQVLLNTINSFIYNFMPKAYESDDDNEKFRMISYSNKEHRRLVQAFKEKNMQEVEAVLKNHWNTIPINQME